MHNLLVPMQFSHRHSCIWIDFEPFQMQASTQKHSKNALSNAFLVSCTCVSLHNLAHFLASVKRFCCKEMNRATQTPFQTPCQTEKCMQSASKPREPACRTCPFCGSQLCNFVSSQIVSDCIPPELANAFVRKQDRIFSLKIAEMLHTFQSTMHFKRRTLAFAEPPT